MTSVIDRQLVFGLTFLALIGLLVAGTVAQYQGAFDETVTVSVEADRAGLTLGSGAPVKLRGVEVGTVAGVETVGDRVRVDLDLDAELAGQVPADVTAQIVPPTAFGAKYVQLTAPRGTEADPIAAGDVIPADRVTVEIDEAFTNLTQVLRAARPHEVNNALTALATAVDGRGERIGQLIDQVDGYLRSFNPSLRTLGDDLRAADGVLDTYASAVPDLVRLVDGATTTSETLVGQQASLHAFVLNLRTFSEDTRTLVRRSEADLRETLRLLEPVSGVLARYSPELPCLVLGLGAANRLAENAVGGTNPGVTTITRFVPGDAPYRYPDNLPQVGDTRGPACYGLPAVTPTEAEAPVPVFRSGANPHAGPETSPSEDALTTLAGILAGAENF